MNSLIFQGSTSYNIRDKHLIATDHLVESRPQASASLAKSLAGRPQEVSLINPPLGEVQAVCVSWRLLTIAFHC